MNHLVKDEKILKRYLKIWNKIKSLIKRELNSEPVYNDKYIKTKIKIYNDKVYTNFQHNKKTKRWWILRNIICNIIKFYFC